MFLVLDLFKIYTNGKFSKDVPPQAYTMIYMSYDERKVTKTYWKRAYLDLQASGLNRGFM